MKKINPLSFLRGLFDVAVASAQPDLYLPKLLPDTPLGRTIVIGAGKASAAMAKTLEHYWDGQLEGLVVTRYGYAMECKRIKVVEAAHPVPDLSSYIASQRIQQLVSGLSERDLVIALVSGGGSSLLVSPLPGITFEDKQNINAALLASGASISEINCVRRHLSNVKGGRLGVLCHPARLVTLLVSDVPGDEPMDIASGPTVVDSTTCAHALAILDRFRISIPEVIRQQLKEGEFESIKPGDSRMQSSLCKVVFTPQMSLEAAAERARNVGIAAYILSDSMEGEARDIGLAHAAIAKQIVHHNQPFQRPCVLLSGGETTVTLRGKGKGGRNVEFLLSMGIALNGLSGVHAIAGDTDGVDGVEEIAGAFLSPSTLARALSKGLNPAGALENNDAHSFFSALNDSVITGPTFTNVNDFRAIYIE